MDDLGKHPKGMDSTPVRERAMHAAQASTEANFYVYDVICKFSCAFF